MLSELEVNEVETAGAWTFPHSPSPRSGIVALEEMNSKTCKPSVAPAEPLAEFGRIRDVERLFGIKRGVLYRLIQRGLVRSVVLREAGRATGCRLVHLASVRAYLHELMAAQNP